MNSAVRSALLLPVCLFMSCGAKVQVNSLPRLGWSKPIDRVLILCEGRPSGSTRSVNDLQVRLAGKLASRSVVTQAWESNILDLGDADKLKAELATFKPHYILRVSQTSATFTNGILSEATFDLRLTEAGLDEPIWRARTSIDLSFGGGLDELALAILAAMKQDGILPS